MPIEIRELVIRATVEQSNNDSENSALNQNSTGDQTNSVLMERIEQLKKIMLEKNER